MRLDEIKAKHHKPIDAKAAHKLLEQHCSLSLKTAQYPIVRGFDASEMKLIDTSKTIRKSTNTSNYYTMIMDSVLPAQFPRRSKSIICTNFAGRQYASSYGNPFAIVPFDSAKIGMCPYEDLWSTPINLFGTTFDIENINGEFFGMDLPVDDFDKFIKAFVARAHELDEMFTFSAAAKLSANKIKAEFVKAYSKPFKALKPGDSQLTSPKPKELWVEGKAIAIPLADYGKMFKMKSIKEFW